MNRRSTGILSLLLFTILAVVYALHLYEWVAVPELVLKTLRWALIVALCAYAVFKRSLTTWILVSMVIGINIGMDFPAFSQNLKVLSQIFLRLVKTVIAPILFATLVVGIAGHSSLKQVGRMGWKSILYFEVVTTIALIIGLIAINISGAGKGILVPEGLKEELPDVKAQGWQDVILHIFPENFAKSVYHGDVLPIVVFSIIFGIALAMLPNAKKKPMLEFSESLAEVMFKFTNIIMYFAPFGVGAAIAVTVGHLGLEVLGNLFQLLITLYIALIVFLLLVLLPVALIIKIPIKNFIKAISEPVSIAFATTSSESALPKAMENMEKFGVPGKIVSFVLPTGYTFNLDGTTLYLSLAAVFVAQAAGIDLSIGEQIIMGLTLMLTSKGVAGVPRASLVILLGTAASFGLPLWPIMAILGIDELMDMARTSVNVIGNTLASCVIARWEGEFDDQKAQSFEG
ncbi:MAG TPA: cation:dicarboxylase symporter family transporter [Ferruginibacter sp.]|nr:cation:dicarboxylase symporter family transporter [Ferruginibacter sp.]HRO05636.1 cation:dicarboxylase symporter family transporter [Ferruginibacter sp.]HRP49184.1 cation:dicarboxylase symporter family transporter [Ferruginibacter sp.]